MTPPLSGTPRVPPPVASERAARVQLVVFDVDGVLTDGAIYVGMGQDNKPVELKRFDILDGLGITLLIAAGIEVALVSGRDSNATRLRAAELGVAEVHHVDGARKVPVIEELLRRRGLEWEHVAFLGDDLPDLPALRRVGLPAAVRDASPEVQALALWTGTRPGGRGAAREFAEALLRARGVWSAVVEEYCGDRDGDA
ncbi:MAG: HAD family hydrolase [Gemmatimonadota bacterium]